MSRVRVAVVGKGGSGKSTVAGTLARLLARHGQRPVLALDSDPMPGLSISLGLGVLEEAMLAGAAERGEDGWWRLKRGIGPARAVSRFGVVAPDGVRFLQAGKATGSGLGPINPSMRAFSQVVRRLSRDQVLRAWSIVGDLSAGTRQAAYDWAPYADTYLVIAEPSWKSALTARRVAGLAAERGAAHIWLVANKVSSEADVSWLEEQVGMRCRVWLPDDPSVAAADRAGSALLDQAPTSTAVAGVTSLMHQLID